MGSKFVSDIAFTTAVKKRQAEMGSREAYQKMAEKRDWQTKITEQLRYFISQRDSFYMASSNAEGQPYIQHRGGPKGFLKVLDDGHLAFADFSGNRQYISIGNFDENNKVHLFLVDYPNRKRIKIWGEASIITGDEDLIKWLKDEDYKVPIERVIKIKINAWDANCPQHIQPRYTFEEIKPYLGKISLDIKQAQ